MSAGLGRLEARALRWWVAWIAASAVVSIGVYACIGTPDRSLLRAARRGDVHGIERALARGADPDAVDVRLVGFPVEPRIWRHNALRLACEARCVGCVELLLRAGAEVDRPDERGGTPLGWSSGAGETEIVRVLLEAGALVVPAGDPGHSALLSACVSAGGRRAVATLALLLEHAPCGAEELESAADAIGRMNYLRRHQHLAEALILLWRESCERGGEPFTVDSRIAELRTGAADVSAPEQLAWTALHWAAGPFGNQQWLDRLLAAGADPNKTTTHGWTPLMAAAFANDAARARALIAAGAEVHARDANDSTALHVAALWGSAGLVDLLLDSGASPWVRTRSGRSPTLDASYNRGEDAEAMRARLEEAKRADALRTERVVLRTDLGPSASLEEKFWLGSVRWSRSGEQLEWTMWHSNPPMDMACVVSVVHADGAARAGTFCTTRGNVRANTFRAEFAERPRAPIRILLEPDAEVAVACESTKIVGRTVEIPLPAPE